MGESYSIACDSCGTVEATRDLGGMMSKAETDALARRVVGWLVTRRRVVCDACRDDVAKRRRGG